MSRSPTTPDLEITFREPLAVVDYPIGARLTLRRWEDEARLDVGMHSLALRRLPAEVRERATEVLWLAALPEIEKLLQLGTLGLDRARSVLYREDSGEELVEAATTIKGCAWQERHKRGFFCAASDVGNDNRTTPALCGECTLPDERIICSDLQHPERTVVGTLGATYRTISSVMCARGKDPERGADCRPGGKECWRRVVTTTAPPDPIGDAPERLADELDFLALKWREQFGSRLFEVKEVRSIAALFGRCETAADFQHHLLALADLLDRFSVTRDLELSVRGDVEGGAKSLAVLEAVADRHFAEGSPHVRVLRDVHRARNSFPAHSSDAGSKALRRLGVRMPAQDWAAAWLQVVTTTLVAVRGLRLAVQGIETSAPDDPDGAGDGAGSPPPSSDADA